jgi:3-oxoacyl-[acyl-carrier protein] reductase
MRMLEGKVAFVTGSARGIGRAVAETFARQGATVILNGRSDAAGLQALAGSIAQAHGAKVSALPGDVADPQVVAGFYQSIFKAHGRLDVLVNNAGILEDHVIGMIPPDGLRRILATNVEGVVHNLQAAARSMGRSGGGSIINLSSIVGVQGHAGQTAYAASKAAVLGITRSAAQELAPKRIRVNAIAPGLIETDMLRNIPAPKLAELRGRILIGRLGTAQDIANAALFLASDLSSYVTGQVLGVDGGLSF